MGAGHFDTPYYSEILKKKVFPHYVVLCTTGEITSAMKEQLREATETKTQHLQFWDRQRILDSYFQHEILLDLQKQLITYVENLRDIKKVFVKNVG